MSGEARQSMQRQQCWQRACLGPGRLGRLGPGRWPRPRQLDIWAKVRCRNPLGFCLTQKCGGARGRSTA
eukprot:8763450-Alexandrium_andersonii.AAC.1